MARPVGAGRASNPRFLLPAWHRDVVSDAATLRGTIARRLVSLLVFVVMNRSSPAQVYPVEHRPTDVRYEVVQSDRFEVIYQEGSASKAAEVLQVLEDALASARAAVGTRRTDRMPVVLNGFNDRGNGFVSTFPFRQELEIAPIKGNSLSPRHPSWLSLVGRHELIHALHGEYSSGFGVGAIARVFSPDFARSLNLWVPSGFAEGVATWYESQGPRRMGRLNHALFTMEYRAAIMEDAWSLAQMLEAPSYSLPNDRFYHGGAFLQEYMEARQPGSFRRIADVHHRFPLFGYGFSLWVGSGRFPASTGRALRDAAKSNEAERQSSAGPFTEPRILAGGPGSVFRRPLWTDSTTLVSYAAGYHRRPGFYTISAYSGEISELSTQAITEDAAYTMNRGADTLFYARYVVDPFVPSRRLATTHHLSIADGRSGRVGRTERLYGPIARPGGGAFAIDNTTASTILDPASGDRQPEWSVAAGATIKTAEFSPDGKWLAALVNDRGFQGLLIGSAEAPSTLKPLLVSDDWSIFDFQWASADEIVFSADPGGVSNAYTYSMARDEVRRLTNARYGVLEPSISPDGRLLAYVDYAHESYRIAVIPYEHAGGSLVDRSLFEPGPGYAERDQTGPNTVTDVSSPRPYRFWKYLRPRYLSPYLTYDFADTRAADVKLGFGGGVAIGGADLLQKVSYSALGYVQSQTIWGRLDVESGHWPVRIGASLLREPGTSTVQLVDDQGNPAGSVRVGREDQAVALNLRLPVVLHSNVFRSTLQSRIGIEYGKDRLFYTENETVRDWRRRATITPAVLLALREQSNVRDIRPNTGFRLLSRASLDVWSDDLAERSWETEAQQLVSVGTGRYGSLGAVGGLLWQNTGGVTNIDSFLPRGMEDRSLGDGVFLKYGVNYLFPVAYVDDGLVILPVFLRALYLYGFAETVVPATAFRLRMDSIGLSLGVQARVLYAFDLDLRFGFAWLPSESEVRAVYR